MEKLKLIQLLKTFSKEEFKVFGKFVRSPYFNNRSELIRFYDTLKSVFPEFTKDRLQKEEIFGKVYNVKYKDVLMRKLVSNMHRLAERFISEILFERNNFEIKKNLITELSKRKLTGLFENEVQKSEKLFNGLAQNSVYFSNKAAISHIKNEHRTITVGIPSVSGKQEEADLLHYFFVSRHLELYLQYINHVKTFSHKYDLKMYDQIISYVGNNITNYPLPAQVNYSLIMLLTKGRLEDYHTLKKYRTGYNDRIDIHLLYNIYVNLTNFCLDMVYEGKHEFRKERYMLDKEFIGLDLFSQKGYFPVSYFTTAVDNAAYYKDIAWAEEFISKYSKSIEPAYRTFASVYSRALLNFASGKYQDVISELVKIPMSNPIWKMQINILTLKANYEAGEYEPAFLIVDSCRHFLRNSADIPEDRIRYYMDFIRYTGKLIEAKGMKSSTKLEELTRKINKSGHFREKEWVLKKIQELN